MSQYNKIEIFFIPLIFVLLWASGSVFVKIGLDYSSVWVFLFLRSFLSGLVFILISYFFMQKVTKVKPFCLYNIKNSIVSGFFLQFLYQTFFFLAISNNLSIGLLALILGLQPIITPFLAREALDKKLYLILCLAFIGLTITLFAYRDMKGFSILGILFAFISVLSISVGTIMQKSNTLPLIDNLKIQFTSASLFYLTPLLFGDWKLNISYEFSFALAWMVLVVSVGATFLLLHMLKKSQASRVSSLFFCVPPVSIFFDCIFFGGKFTYTIFIGAFITLISVREFFKLTKKELSKTKSSPAIENKQT